MFQEPPYHKQSYPTNDSRDASCHPWGEIRGQQIISIVPLKPLPLCASCPLPPDP